MGHKQITLSLKKFQESKIYKELENEFIYV